MHTKDQFERLARRTTPLHAIDKALEDFAVEADMHDSLGKLSAARFLRRAIEDYLSDIEHEAARRAWHIEGHSWRRIGEACGISRQTAQQTYQHGQPSRQTSAWDNQAAPPEPRDQRPAETPPTPAKPPQAPAAPPPPAPEPIEHLTEAEIREFEGY